MSVRNMASTSSSTIDPDFVHPAIVVPVIPRIKIYNLPKMVARDWLRKQLSKVTKKGVHFYQSIFLI